MQHVTMNFNNSVSYNTNMSILEKSIGWLAPPLCVGCGQEGQTICFACQQTEIIPYGEHCGFCARLSSLCRTCSHCRASAPRHVWVVTDYIDVAKDLVQAYKFGHIRAAALPLAQMMTDRLSDFLSSEEVSKLNYLVVPVPTATTRVRQRSFDHSVLLAQKIGVILRLDSANVLSRKSQIRQVGAKRPQRIAQAVGVYDAWRPDKIRGRNILLIDDVITTGATLKSATKVLRANGARRIDALVFAKSI